MSEKYLAYPEKYYYWPGFNANNIQESNPNFENGEQDVLVGFPDFEAVQVIYDDQGKYNEAADQVEIFLILLFEKIKAFDKNSKKQKILEKVEDLKIIATKMKNLYPTYALRVEFRVNSLIEEYGLDMKKFDTQSVGRV